MTFQEMFACLHHGFRNAWGRDGSLLLKWLEKNAGATRAHPDHPPKVERYQNLFDTEGLLLVRVSWGEKLGSVYYDEEEGCHHDTIDQCIVDLLVEWNSGQCQVLQIAYPVRCLTIV